MTSSRNNQGTEEDQLYDILNLSPPSTFNNGTYSVDDRMDRPSLQQVNNNSLTNDVGATFQQLKARITNTDNSNKFLHNVNVNLGMSDIPTSSNKFKQPEGYSESMTFLSPNNMIESGSQDFLNPNSPSVYSMHSSYSDVSSNPGSPYIDAVSHFSGRAYSEVGRNPDIKIENQKMYLETAHPLNNFDNEIGFGESISSTNLVDMNKEYPQQFSYSLNNEWVSDFNDQPNSIPQFSDMNRLTEMNLNQYNNSIQQQNHPREEVTISVQKASEEYAARTQSLFSNSSANSSVVNSPYKNPHPHSYNGSSNLTPNSHLVASSPGSVTSDISDSNSHLKPEELQGMRVGRRKNHSNRIRSRSNSRSPMDSGEENEESTTISSSREKMLELASPNQSSKRTQKHPSIYACHLCDKRFTRPYNLKSHLRTHTDERPFICNVCGKAFARQHDRKRHEDLHTGEKKFQCKGILKNGSQYGCGRKFARADALRRHFQTEAGKECIRLLVEEEERDKINIGSSTNDGTYSRSQSEISNDYLSPNSALVSVNSNIPQVAISPPD